MPHQREEIGRSEAGGAAADHSYLFSGLRRGRRGGHFAGMIHRKALDAPDIQGIVHNVTTAVGFAGVFADQRAHRGEGVVFANQPDGVGIPAVTHQRQIAGNVHMSWALGYAGNTVKVGGAASVFQMGKIVILERGEAVQNQFCGFKSNGAVRAVGNRLGSRSDHLQIAGGSLSLQ